jgi:rRNA small subunit pseudouridine methyltransferase Nep1
LVLTLVLAESAIELVPNQITAHPTVTKSALKKNKDPHRLILDQSYHHAAILRLEGRGVGRGRPDIAHLALLLALGSPLNMEGELRCFVHTQYDHVITVNPRARLPRNTDRFTSLLEQLFEESVVPSSGTPLMSIRRESLVELLQVLHSDLVVALTMQGTPQPLEVVASELAKAKAPVVLVGGFPKGHFSGKTTEASSREYRIDRRPLEAWTVVARGIYEYEKAIGLARFQ